MKITISKMMLAAFFFIMFTAIAFSDGGDPDSGAFKSEENIKTQTGSETISLELINSWQALAVLGLIISIILIALAYAISIGFDMPDLKAWAGTELNQVFANALLIVLLFVIVAFLDVISAQMVNETNPGGLRCALIGDNCMQKVGVQYLKSYIDAANTSIKDVVANNVKESAWAARGVGIYATSIILGQAAVNFPLAANKVLDVDRYNVVFEYYTGIMSSLQSQKFFLEQYAYKVGPMILALGIVARSFFFSRKTGGLLVAIAAGVMFFLPAMYLFDWVTLDMAVEGDNAVADEGSNCSEECGMTVPLAYYPAASTVLNSTEDIYAVFPDTEDGREKARKIASGESGSEIISDSDLSLVISCNYDSDPNDGAECPPQCRELPYPNSMPECAVVKNQTACAKLDPHCKIIRLIPDPEEHPEYYECPEECKIIPPLRSDCDVKTTIGRRTTSCLESRLDCRVAKRDDLDYRPTVDSKVQDAYKCNSFSKICPASLNAYETCVWILPESGSCDDLCAGCPSYCRIRAETADIGNMAADCFTSSTKSEANLLEACKKCTSTCKMDIADIIAIAPDPEVDKQNCSACPYEKRFMESALPDDLRTGGCSFDENTGCPADYRTYPYRGACEKCIFTPESYQYYPPINTECGELCKPDNKVPLRNAAEYAKISADGFVGMSEIKTVSKFMIPAYLLPLFNIVATLVFIKGLSGLIGGDIEIPGISKIF